MIGRFGNSSSNVTQGEVGCLHLVIYYILCFVVSAFFSSEPVGILLISILLFVVGVSIINVITTRYVREYEELEEKKKIQEQEEKKKREERSKTIVNMTHEKKSLEFQQSSLLREIELLQSIIQDFDDPDKYNIEKYLSGDKEQNIRKQKLQDLQQKLMKIDIEIKDLKFMQYIYK